MRRFLSSLNPRLPRPVQLLQVGLLGLGLTGEVRLDPLRGIHLELDASDLANDGRVRPQPAWR